MQNTITRPIRVETRLEFYSMFWFASTLFQYSDGSGLRVLLLLILIDRLKLSYGIGVNSFTKSLYKLYKRRGEVASQVR